MSAQRWWSMDRRHDCQWPGEVDLECQQALDRNHHDQGCNDRTVGLHRHHRRQHGQSGVHLDGRGNDGRVWPEGSYTLTATAVDSNKQSVGISTEVEAVVGSVDLTGSSPVLHARQDQADRPVVRLRRRLQEADARGRARASPMTCSIARSSTESSNGLRKISKRPSAA